MSSEKSSFSQTCSLLRQYLKEKGSLGELSLGITCNTTGSYEMSRPVATMNLFPVPEKPADRLSGNSSNMNVNFCPQSGYNPASSQNKLAAKETEAAPMTIFYDGRVIVIDDFPADKAKEIMLFASQQNQGSFAASNQGKEKPRPSADTIENPAGPAKSVCPTSDTPAPPKFGNALMPEHIHCSASQPIICDLPIQRKASLHRFLEKRKDRINRSTPYQTSSPLAVSSKPAEADRSTFSKPAKISQSTSWVAVERDLLSNLSS